MTLRDDLASGELGLRFALPAGFELVQEARGALLLRDVERQVAWEIAVTPWPLDLRAEHEPMLRGDVERDARAAFEVSFAEIAATEGGGGDERPRTADPAWSPVVAIERVELGGAPALQVIHRLTYQPGHELITGRLLVPVAIGLVEIGASHLARATGGREASRLAMVEGDRALAQADFDDATYDILFPEHPLSLVRAALLWLRDPEGAALEVLAPMAAPSSGEIALPAAGAAIVPPPRYVRLADGVVAGPAGSATFARVGLSGTDVRLFTVARLAEDRIAGAERSEKLKRVARRALEARATEGAEDLTVSAWRLPDEGARAQVGSYLRFKAGGRPRHAAARWLADADGAVLRVESTAPPWVPKDELLAEVEAAARALRRIDALAPAPEVLAPAAPVRKWWKPW